MNEEACSLGWIAVALSIVMLFQTELWSFTTRLLRRVTSVPDPDPKTSKIESKRVTLIESSLSQESNGEYESACKEGFKQPGVIVRMQEIPLMPVKPTSFEEKLPDLCCSLTTQASESSMNELEPTEKGVSADVFQDTKTVDVSHVFATKSVSRRSDRIDPTRAMEISQRVVGRLSYRHMEDSGSIHSFISSKLQTDHREPQRRRVTRRASCSGCYTPALRRNSIASNTPCLSSRTRLGRQNSQSSLLSMESLAVAEALDDDQYFRRQESQSSLWSNDDDGGVPAVQLVPTRSRMQRRRSSVQGHRVHNPSARSAVLLPSTIRPLERRGSQGSLLDSQGSLGYGYCPAEDSPPARLPVDSTTEEAFLPPRRRPGRRASISEGMTPKPLRRRSSIHGACGGGGGGGRGSGSSGVATWYEFLPQTIYVG